MLGFLRRFNNNGNGGEQIPGVLPCEEFSRALERERSRADRTNSPLSFVVIWETSSRGAEAALADGSPVLPRLARIFAARVRCTDVVGWFERDKLGVLLPHTPGERAWILLDDVGRELKEVLGSEDANGVSYCVHTYPFEDQGQANGVRQLRLFAGTADDLERASEDGADVPTT